MFWRIYLRQGIVYLPTIARTEAGFYLDTGPVLVDSAADSGGLQNALKETICRGNPPVPTPTRRDFPKPVILKYAKVRSWEKFEKGAAILNIRVNEGLYEVSPGRKRKDAGWGDDLSRARRFPSNSSLESVAYQIATLVQNTTE